MLKRLYLTLLVIGFSLRPTPPGESGGKSTTASCTSRSQTVHLIDSKKKIRTYLADLNLGVDPDGGMKLHFAGCYAVAAPFLLYRLKRSGFSSCRASMTDQGLLLSASR
ncbi:MAG TPA: hypothetical protein VMC44_02720 [Geobacteraceae bacterium]|nr:hypothetical protein [Geobacteraceae bacterium]